MAFPQRIDPDTIGAQALAIVEGKGWAEWSLREVAKELGVTPNALYRYVGDRSGLVIEIAAAAAEALTAELSSVRGARGSERRLLAIAHRYVSFGMRRPHAYAAFIEAKPDPDHPRIGPWLALWAVVRQEVARSVPHAADAAGFALWALLHGRIQLAQGPARAASPKAGLDDAVSALIAGFQSMGKVASPLPPPMAQE